MRSLLDRADIVCVSYLGKDAELIKTRYDYHLRQREALDTLFPNLKVVTAATGWQNDYCEDFAAAGHSLVLMSKKPMLKAQVHNRLFDKLYKHKNKAVLFLDDDVAPDPVDHEGLDMIQGWLEHPEWMPVPCLFFSCKGTLRDSFTNARKQTFSNTQAVTGWAMLIHSSLGVKYRESDMVHNGLPIFDDMVFRYRIASQEKECLKCLQIYFETFQKSQKDKDSVWCKDREDRRAIVDRTEEAIMELYPWLLLESKKKGKKILRPVWSHVKGQKLKTYLAAGLLRKGHYGYPVPTKKLKAVWEEERQPKPNLQDLLGG